MRPDGHAVVVLTNDEITVGPVAGAAGGLGRSSPDSGPGFRPSTELCGRLALPALAKGQGSLTLGEKTLTWTIACGGREVSGTIPWMAIQTVVMPCGAP